MILGKLGLEELVGVKVDGVLKILKSRKVIL